MRLTIDQTGSTINRLPKYSDAFYSTQGYQRPGDIDRRPWLGNLASTWGLEESSAQLNEMELGMEASPTVKA